jgi:citrate lyase subunit beta/citryl-CoA lyase
MKLRSMLFVPGDSERKFAKAAAIGADALILDLEDSVAPSEKPRARAQVAALLDAPGPRPWALFVRVNALDTGLALEDLAAVVKPGLDGIMLPKAQGSADIDRVGHYLDALEAKAGLAPGAVKLCPVATETARAMFALASYLPHPRLTALTWGGEDLAAALGATANRDEAGAWTSPYEIARVQALFAAAAAEATPIDTIHADFRDLAGLEADCRRSRRDGFLGRMAIHPDQVAVLNACYTPSEAEIAHARRIVEAFAAAPGAGALGIDGKMVDIPHLKAAQTLLASV